MARWPSMIRCGFQFLGIPPKGEQHPGLSPGCLVGEFPISRDPPEGGTHGWLPTDCRRLTRFPISRDPPEGGTARVLGVIEVRNNVSNF